MRYFKFLFALVVVLFAANTVQAAKILVVLELVSASDEIDLSISETRHLTDELRRQAVQTLPNKDYTVLTRDNMFSLIPSDEKEAQRLANSSAVEIGKAMGAEYVSQGSIGSFGELLTISIELYETISGKLLGSIVIESKDVIGLLAMIREKSPELFVKIMSEPELTEPKKLQNDEKILQVTTTQEKSNSSLFVAIGLDVLGAAALGYGIYQHINSNKLYNDYKKMPQDLAMDKYYKALKKANDAQRQRNIGYTIGSTLLATGIAVHIWF